MLQQLYFLLTVLFSISCLGAAEAPHSPAPANSPTQTLFQIITRTMINQGREIGEQVTLLPEHLLKIIGQYAEKQKTVTAIGFFHRVPDTGKFEYMECSEINWIPLIRISQPAGTYYIEMDNRLHEIALVVGIDYSRKQYLLTSISNGEIIATPDNALSKAFGRQHPGVWFAPGDIELFLSTSCSNGNLEAAHQQALDEYAQRVEKDKKLPPRLLPLVGFFAPPQNNQPLFLASLLPAALHRIIFGYLQTNAQKSHVIMNVAGLDGKRERELVNQIAFRGLLEGEEVFTIQGLDAHRRPHLLTCANTVPPTADYAVFLEQLMARCDSVQKKKIEEMHAIVNTTPALFLVPSLIERFLTGKLTDNFLQEYPGIYDQDLVLDSGALDSAVAATPARENTIHNNGPSENQNAGDGGPEIEQSKIEQKENP